MIDPVRYTTSDVAEKDRFAYWREAVCDSYVKLGCECSSDIGFEGGIEITRHSALNVSNVWGTSHSVERRKSDIRCATDEFFLFSLQLQNQSRVTQGASSALLKAGDMALYDSSRPYRLDLSNGFRQMVVQLPADHLLARLPNARLLTGTLIDGQSVLGQLVRNNICAFSEQILSSNNVLRVMLQETLIDLIATGLAATNASSIDLKQPEQHILVRTRNVIAERITDPDLNREQVAQIVGISVRHLNHVLGKFDSSLSNEIRLQRLRRVSAELRDPRFTALSVSEIALRCGYNNLQHFSTAFRKAYDVTPSAYRASDRHHEQ